MRYFLDTEFNGFGGDLISLALVAEDGRSLYVAGDCKNPAEWVKDNVIPIIDCEGAYAQRVEPSQIGAMIAEFLMTDEMPLITADWPDDIRYFCGIIRMTPQHTNDSDSLVSVSEAGAPEVKVSPEMIAAVAKVLGQAYDSPYVGDPHSYEAYVAGQVFQAIARLMAS